MRNIIKILSLSGLMIFLAFSTSSAQKIAHVDSDAVIPAMQEYKTAKSQVEDYSKQLQNQLKAEEEKMMKYYQQVMTDAQSGKLSPQQQQEAEQKLQGMQQALQKKAMEADQKLMEKETSLTKPLYDKFNSALEKVAKENGYAYIFDKKLLLYSDGGIDATAKIKAALGLGW
ncbi:MAG: OmpH family outer membrane protein [Aureispira sp.]|nr:OmpH family outer membrane protein [Aureispira sp.]